ncbi:MAG: redoxin domain-containing protein [Fimbriimonadaceae bacterium]|nr:redoxin domain-containing protein [Fimbriimonadaceae bacterium]
MRHRLFWLGSFAALSGLVAAQNIGNPGNRRFTAKEPATSDESHSAMGGAFDFGPRFRAPLRAGVGNVRFAITTKNPKAQQFFDQGLNYVYTFEWVEAERSFREAALLDPKAPMPYWGLALCDNGRSKEFLALAVARRDNGGDRERRYIDAFQNLLSDTGDRAARIDANCQAFREIVKAYPDDLEARAFLAWQLINVDSGGYQHYDEIERLFNEIFSKNPDHPGAHHYRIHMYDNRGEPEKALENARGYLRAVPNIGHGQHMPGHIFASVGRWYDAAEAQDKATRVERKHMGALGTLPFQSWNYPHNQDYLISNLGYLGRIREGTRLAQELLDGPRDPRFNTGTGYSPAGTGRTNRLRMLLRGDLWADIVEGYAQEDPRLPDSKFWRYYALGHAYLGLGDLPKANEQAALLAEAASGKMGEVANLDLRGRIAVAEGRLEAGFADLERAVSMERDGFLWGDPPSFLKPVYESLAEAYLQHGMNEVAERLLIRALDRQPENAFALAQLVRAQLAQKEVDEAVKTDRELRRLRPFDRPLPALDRLIAAWVTHAPGRSPYRKESGIFVWDTPPEGKGPSAASLEAYGPDTYRPFTMPNVALTRSDGKRIETRSLAGKPAVLIFYLGGKCLHCVAQLQALNKLAPRFGSAGAAIVAACPDPPSDLAAFQKTAKFAFPLAHDPGFRGARAFHAYDEYEDRPLHATILLDPRGRVWWYDVGVEPFDKFDWLLTEVKRMAEVLARPDAP